MIGSYFGSRTFGEGSGPVFMDYVNCNGSENSIVDCRHFSHSYGCTHSDDVGIRCEPGTYAHFLIVKCHRCVCIRIFHRSITLH